VPIRRKIALGLTARLEHPSQSCLALKNQVVTEVVDCGDRGASFIPLPCGCLMVLAGEVFKGAYIFGGNIPCRVSRHGRVSESQQNKTDNKAGHKSDGGVTPRQTAADVLKGVQEPAPGRSFPAGQLSNRGHFP
jgi:hypothetical protein